MYCILYCNDDQYYNQQNGHKDRHYSVAADVIKRKQNSEEGLNKI